MKKIYLFLLLSIFLLNACELKSKTTKNILSPEEAKTKTISFINENLMTEGNEASVGEVSEEYGMYKLKVSISGGEEVISYLSKDGNNFFPQVINIKEIEDKKEEQEKLAEQAKVDAQKKIEELPKKEKPEVELFIMSHCPYGTQIEKGIIPVVEKLGNKIDFKLRFVDYVMHDKKEIDEQLTQYCIQKNETEKLLPYLKCFLEKGDNSEECLKDNKINQNKLKSCVKETDKNFKITEQYNDKSKWRSSYPNFDINRVEDEQYGIGGSPGLVINGQKISSGRSPQVLLKNICNGFEEQPEECKAELSNSTPSPGFGYGISNNSSSDVNCGE